MFHRNTEARRVSCYWMLHSIYLEKKWQFDMYFGPGCSLTFNSNSNHSALFTWEVIHLIAKLKGELFFKKKNRRIIVKGERNLEIL